MCHISNPQPDRAWLNFSFSLIYRSKAHLRHALSPRYSLKGAAEQSCEMYIGMQMEHTLFRPIRERVRFVFMTAQVGFSFLYSTPALLVNENTSRVSHF